MKADKDYILNMLSRIAEAIAETFGESCETLVHDMEKPGYPIAAIYNGHVSGRSVGDTTDIFGHDSYREGLGSYFKPGEDYINMMAVTPDGRKIKSTTVECNTEEWHYAIGINFDCTDIGNAADGLRKAVDMMERFLMTDRDLDKAVGEKISTSLEGVFIECMNEIGLPAAAMKKKDRVRLIGLLNERDAFSYQKSVSYVAEQLGVSRYTIYEYIRELEKED